MFISQTAEYAIRAMSAIAILPDGIKIRAIDLGRATGIPAPYLSSVVLGGQAVAIVSRVSASAAVPSRTGVTPRSARRFASAA